MERTLKTRPAFFGEGSIPGGMFLLVALGLAFLPLSALASGGDRIPGSRYVSGRGAALGDAYIGFADTLADSLFYNPAGLGKVNGATFEPLNAQIQMNDKLSGSFGTDFYKFQNLNDYQATLAKHPNTNPGGGYAILPAFGFKGFGMGVLYQSRLMAETNGTNTRYRVNNQFIPAAGIGLPLASGVLRLGYVLQYVNQASGDVSAASNSSLGWTKGLAEGHGFSHNLGLALTLPYIYQPSINVVARNFGGVHYSGKPMVVSASGASGSIPDEKTSLDSSIGAVTKISGGWSLAAQLAYRDGLNSSNTRMIEHIATGLEFTAFDRVFLRAGFGSGYPSAGLGLRTSRAEVNFAWFSEDLGDGTTPQRDMRYLFQFLFKAF